MSIIIKLNNLNKFYSNGNNRVHALKDINFEVENGEFVAITGPSGSGKSTLLHNIGCIDKPSSGNVFFNGIDVSKFSSGELAKFRLNSIGFVFQHFYLLPSLTAFENIELPLQEAGVSKKKRTERVKYLLEAVGLYDRSSHRPGQLSGGEQQRVAIARALANDPPLILADEPTGELDSKTGTKIIDILIDINKNQGKTTLVVTHDENISKRASRVIRIIDGSMVSDVR
jgi:putative ABC transport system ATP-binding protein